MIRHAYEDDPCTACGAKISRHRTRGGRWVGCRADDLRARASMAAGPIQGFALALNPAGGALNVAVPFSLTPPVSTATDAHQKGLFDGE